MEEIKIHCQYTELCDAASLVPNPRNPNRHPKRQIELLAKIIETQGWRQPVTVSNRSGFIVRGHGRLEVAMLIGCKVPVERQDYASEAEEWADLVADNRIAELASIDNDELAKLLSELDELDIDNAFTTTADFVEGAGKKHKAGADVGIVNVGTAERFLSRCRRNLHEEKMKKAVTAVSECFLPESNAENVEVGTAQKRGTPVISTARRSTVATGNTIKQRINPAKPHT